MEKNQPIQPLFILAYNLEKMGDAIIQFTQDDYNKEFGSSLIDAEAISTFYVSIRIHPKHCGLTLKKLNVYCYGVFILRR